MLRVETVFLKRINAFALLSFCNIQIIFLVLSEKLMWNGNSNSTRSWNQFFRISNISLKTMTTRLPNQWSFELLYGITFVKIQWFLSICPYKISPYYLIECLPSSSLEYIIEKKNRSFENYSTGYQQVLILCWGLFLVHGSHLGAALISPLSTFSSISCTFFDGIMEQKKNGWRKT